jgi:hypothetical protein
MCTNGLSLAQLELRDRLASGSDLRLLAGDRGEVLDGTIDDLAVAGSLADTGVHDDLHQSWDLVDVRESEVLLELRCNLGLVLLLQARLWSSSRRSSLGVSHYRSLPDFLA